MSNLRGRSGGGGFDSRAIDVREVPNTQTAIRAWIEDVNEVLRDIESNEDKYMQGILGVNQEAAIHGYVVGAINQIRGLTGYLEEFSDDIGRIALRYAQTQGDVAAGIGEVNRQETVVSSGFND